MQKRRFHINFLVFQKAQQYCTIQDLKSAALQTTFGSSKTTELKLQLELFQA